MSELRYVKPNSVITGWDFSTGAVKCLAFDLKGNTLAEVRLPTDLWTEGGVSELSLLQLEGQARASVRAMASKLRDIGRLDDWIAGGISGTHHTAGRLDANQVQVRRAICWNDQTLAEYHGKGLERLGGDQRVRQLINGPWAIRYSLSHLVKDEQTLSEADWQRTQRIVTHGPASAGFLTGNFDVISVSAAASTGIMDMKSREWCREMLDAIESPSYRELAWKQLPQIIDHYQPVGPLSENIALEAGIASDRRPLVFPTSDDQQAGLVGGGAVDAGQLAIILGNSAVVNSAAGNLPKTDNLDLMALNWGPYLLMRCYTNGAQFLDPVVGPNPDWAALAAGASACGPVPDGASVLPFLFSEPSLGVHEPRYEWSQPEPTDPGVRFRVALEALAYLMALGVEAHEQAGQTISRISVSGGIAKSKITTQILASVLGKPLVTLESDEGPALGAAVTALAAMENHLRKADNDDEPYTVGDAVNAMVRFAGTVDPVAEWQGAYADGLAGFRAKIGT